MSSTYQSSWIKGKRNDNSLKLTNKDHNILLKWTTFENSTLANNLLCNCMKFEQPVRSLCFYEIYHLSECRKDMLLIG